MDKSNNDLKEESTQNSQNRDDFLVVSINKTGKIVQFNKKCEKVSGYSKEEALNKGLIDFLIPESYFEVWGRLFNLARQDKVINDLKLPWLTRNGQEIMISWSSFPIEEIGGETEDICLLGKLIISDNDSKEPIIGHIKEGIDDKEFLLNFIRAGLKKEEDIDDKIKGAEEKGISFALGNKRIVIKEASSGGYKDVIKNVIDKDTKNISLKEEKESTSTKPIETVKPLKTVKPVETLDEKKLDEIYKLTLKNYEDIHKTIKDLEKRNDKLEKEKKKLEQIFVSFKTPISDIKDDKKPHKTGEFIRKKTSTLVNSLSGKKKREELDRMIHELDERKNFLDNLEAQLTREKGDINEQRNEFCKWREKLEFLEDEIEKRRVELVDQEKIFKDQFIDSSRGEVTHAASPESVREMQDVHHEILDKIPRSAAIVKRGILKQVNPPFIELLGYDTNILLEKSLLDFIAPEGISGIEEYYLSRLKGGVISTYETVFLTKDNNKLAVKVSIKPTIFNGENAEIAVFNKAGNKQEDEIASKEEEKIK